MDQNKFRLKFFRKYWTVVFQSCSFSKKMKTNPHKSLNQCIGILQSYLTLCFAHTHLNVNRNSMLRAICVLSNGAKILWFCCLVRMSIVFWLWWSSNSNKAKKKKKNPAKKNPCKGLQMMKVNCPPIFFVWTGNCPGRSCLIAWRKERCTCPSLSSPFSI